MPCLNATRGACTPQRVCCSAAAQRLDRKALLSLLLVSVAAVLFGTGAVALTAYRHYAKPGGQKPAATDFPPFVTGSTA